MSTSRRCWRTRRTGLAPRAPLTSSSATSTAGRWCSATPTASRRSSPTSSATPSSTRPTAARSRSRALRAMALSRSASATTASASPRSSSSASSAATSATRRRRARSSAPASAWPSHARSSRCTAARSGSTARSATAPTSTSPCPRRRCRTRPPRPSRPGPPRPSALLQELRHQRLEVVHAVLAQRGEPAAGVGARPQSSLHLLTDRDVLLLDLVGECDRLLHRLPARAGARFGEVPLEDCQRPFGAVGEDDVGAQVVLVDVQHRVRKDPVVEGVLLRARHADVAAVAARHLAGLQLPDRRVLLGVVAKRLHPVVVVLELLEETGVRDRKVVALEVVVDIHLPVARDVVVAALDQTHRVEVVAGPGDLRGDGANPVGERRGVGVEVDEDEGAESVHADRHEAEVGLVEVLCSLHLARGLQPAVEAVHPAVVAALERLAVAAQ